MRLLVAKQPLRRMVLWTERLLFAAGLALLAWCAYVVLDARIFQQAEDSRLDGLLRVSQETSPGAPHNPSFTARPARLLPAPAAGPIGRHDDMVTLAALLGEFRYRVVSTSIVRPDNIAVLAPTENQILTLVTCYPFYFVGPAPTRFIVRAERIDDTSSLLRP